MVKTPSSYNVILERSDMVTFLAVASALHWKINFSVENAFDDVQGEQKTCQKCYVEEVRVEQKVAKTENPDLQNPREHDHLNLFNDAAQLTTNEKCKKFVISAPRVKFE